MNKLKGEPYPTCDICNILETEPTEGYPTLVTGEHWTSMLRDRDQSLLGTVFITARRHVAELDMLTEAEEQELVVIRNSLIRAIRSSFNPITFNVSCLKNDTFKHDIDASPDATHVHWHVKPRYNKPVVVNDEEFVDPAPGKYLTTFERHQPSPETARMIFQTIKDAL